MRKKYVIYNEYQYCKWIIKNTTEHKINVTYENANMDYTIYQLNVNNLDE